MVAFKLNTVLPIGWQHKYQKGLARFPLNKKGWHSHPFLLAAEKSAAKFFAQRLHSAQLRCRLR